MEATSSELKGFATDPPLSRLRARLDVSESVESFSVPTVTPPESASATIHSTATGSMECM